MSDMDEILAELTSRLPELEWKISRLPQPSFAANLPKGLFQLKAEVNGESCIKEIKLDIQALSRQTNERSIKYLAERIQQKINVLVTLCLVKGKGKPNDEKRSFDVNTLSTRQEWIHSIENEITRLTRQQQAMQNTIQHLTTNQQLDQLLIVQAELGELERQLTLAKEALDKMTC
jgi:hypothetical protein